jgi:hypothetical protein
MNISSLGTLTNVNYLPQNKWCLYFCTSMQIRRIEKQISPCQINESCTVKQYSLAYIEKDTRKYGLVITTTEGVHSLKTPSVACSVKKVRRLKRKTV